MDSQKHIILVPTDFTEIGDYAIAHAVKFSKLLNKEIMLLHVIKSETEYQEAEKQITQKADEIVQKYQVHVQTILREGTIFSTIGEAANELNALLVIMGTHGRKKLQKITGSWALKVIVKSKAPCIVVHDYPENEKFEKIVFPVDFRKEFLEKIGWLIIIAKLFKSKVYVFKSNSHVKFLGFIKFNDKSFLKKVFSHSKLAEKQLKNNNIEYEVTTAQPRKDFAEQTVEFSESINADLILITTTKSINFADYIIGASEQSIIDNPAKIPVMCINPRPTIYGSFSATGN